MSWLWIVVGLVAAQRLVELLVARRNTRRLLAEGGVEVGAGHYPWLVGLHAAWLASMLVWIAPDAPVSWPLLGFFLFLQAGRMWVVTSLGRYWTTRIVTVPGAPLVGDGPYRFVRHPNYLIVALEIATLPLAFGAWQIAAVFSILNAVLLSVRIRVEDGALGQRRTGPGGYSESIRKARS